MDTSYIYSYVEAYKNEIELIELQIKNLAKKHNLTYDQAKDLYFGDMRMELPPDERGRKMTYDYKQNKVTINNHYRGGGLFGW